MALTLVTTPGDAAANAYVTVDGVTAVADELFPAPQDWYEASDDDRARAIVVVTRRIDEENFAQPSTRTSSTQALAFPRSMAPAISPVSTDYGYGVGYEDATTIPARVVRATAIGAIALVRLAAKNPENPDSALVSEDARLQSFALGSEFSATLEPGESGIPAFERVFAQLVRPILGTLVTGPQVRLVRG